MTRVLYKYFTLKSKKNTKFQFAHYIFVFLKFQRNNPPHVSVGWVPRFTQRRHLPWRLYPGRQGG